MTLGLIRCLGLMSQAMVANRRLWTFAYLQWNRKELTTWPFVFQFVVMLRSRMEKVGTRLYFGRKKSAIKHGPLESDNKNEDNR